MFLVSELLIENCIELTLEQLIKKLTIAKGLCHGEALVTFPKETPPGITILRISGEE